MDSSFTSESTALDIIIQRKLDQMHVGFPGKITAFDAATQTCTVSPSIQMKVTIDNDVKYVNLPQLNKVPVIFPFAQTAGYCVTIPIQAGDTCFIMIPDRAMESFLNGNGDPSAPFVGGEAPVSNVRAHSLTDAVCIPGLSTSGMALPEYSTEAVELRDRERKAFISLGPNGIEINDGKGYKQVIANGGCTTEASGDIRVTTPQDYTIESRNMDLSGDGNTFGNGIHLRTGTVTDGEGVVLGSHVHIGVEPGSGNTGVPDK